MQLSDRPARPAVPERPTRTKPLRLAEPHGSKQSWVRGLHAIDQPGLPTSDRLREILALSCAAWPLSNRLLDTAGANEKIADKCIVTVERRHDDVGVSSHHVVGVRRTAAAPRRVSRGGRESVMFPICSSSSCCWFRATAASSPWLANFPCAMLGLAQAAPLN